MWDFKRADGDVWVAHLNGGDVLQGFGGGGGLCIKAVGRQRVLAGCLGQQP